MTGDILLEHNGIGGIIKAINSPCCGNLMRIKIEGPVTVERLAEALAIALQRCNGHVTGFYGANLYLNAFNDEGEQFELANADGKPSVIVMKTPSGELSKPILSKAASLRREQIKQKREAEERRQNEQYLLRQRLANQESERVRQAYLAEMRARERDAAMFRSVFEKHGDAFIADLNMVISAVWDEHKPMHSNGKEKGMLRKRPVIRVIDGRPKIGSAKTLYRFESPKYNGPRRAPYWTFPEWTNIAVPRLLEMIAEYYERDARMVA